jgi:hypothetical protein
LVRSSVSTSWGFHSLPTAKVEAVDPLHPNGKNEFVELFEIVATTDTTRYICVPEALRFRETVCGGEESVRQYCQDIAYHGGKIVAEILCTGVMDNRTKALTRYCFTNVRLPLQVNGPQRERTKEASGGGAGQVGLEELSRLVKWVIGRAQKDFDTYIPAKFHAGTMWLIR